MPSQLLFIDDDPLAAWNLNNAVWMFGSALNHELEKNPTPDKESKKEEQRRTRIIVRWLPKAPGAAPDEEPKPVKKGQFRDPKPTK